MGVCSSLPSSKAEHAATGFFVPPSVIMPTSSDTIPPFPKDGVTLSLLDEIIATFSESNLAGLTTTKVNEMFVKPYCSNTKLSLCDQLKSAGNPGVKRANVFISHAWSCIFLEVIDALKNHFFNVANKTDIVIWFDLFSNNQLLAPNLDFNWWATTFKEAIHEFGYTLMILAPWENPTPLTRAWCLYEIYCTVETNSKFEVAMSDKEETDFSNVLCSDFDAVNKLLAIVNVSSSQCYKIEDRYSLTHSLPLTPLLTHSLPLTPLLTHSLIGNVSSTLLKSVWDSRRLIH